ncbi:MAG: hypothetical protein QNJ06_00785 [Kiloniellales bacterium]|nr:hypothetical protein [Kiloniellales bacterium]MDJ0968404.1 hypothetical protein [Kiloniellales bacterium]
MPHELAELAEAEAVVLRALRRWIVGSSSKDPRLWSLAWNDLAVAFGTEPGREVLTALIGMVREICGYARRPIEYHQPCCPCVCADEVCILALVGACQRQEMLAARGLAEWLVLREGAPGLLEAARDVASVLAAQGCQLPDRSAPTPGPAFRTAALRAPTVTLH